MNGRFAARAIILAAATALGACVAVGGGYDGDSYVGGFYEPFGYDYGGWGPGYRVGPYGHGDHWGGERGGGDRSRGSHGGAPHPAYHPAGPSRQTPSIPRHPRRH